jgi:queuine tRNA-ribosyltransferase
MNMKKQIFKIIKKDKKTKARIGILNTKKGKIKTPFFMPVATKATGKFVSSMKLNEVSNAIISNSLILSINPGEKRIKNAGGIGKFMNYKGINFTDSGGFQMYSRSLYKKSNENGVYFKNPLSGETIFMTPEKNIEIQNNIGAEVIMCLDRMPLYSDSKKEIENAIILTTKWAKRCKIHHEKIQNKIPQKKRQLLFAITQGGIYKDLRQKSAKDLLKLDFDGYAIGGIALPKSCYENINKAKKLEHNAIKIHKKIIPENKICYVMGEGDPYWLVEAISLGCDVFDSKFPTECARRGTLFTSLGKIKNLNLTKILLTKNAVALSVKIIQKRISDIY